MSQKIIVTLFISSFLLGCSHTPSGSATSTFSRLPSQAEVGNGSIGAIPAVIKHESCALAVDGDIYGYGPGSMLEKGDLKALKKKGYQVLKQELPKPANYIAIVSKGEHGEIGIYELDLVKNGVPYFAGVGTIQDNEKPSRSSLRESYKYMISVMPKCEIGNSSVAQVPGTNVIEAVGQVSDKPFTGQTVYSITYPMHKQFGIRFGYAPAGPSPSPKDMSEAREVCRHFGFDRSAQDLGENIDHLKWYMKLENGVPGEFLAYLNSEKMAIEKRDADKNMLHLIESARGQAYKKIYCFNQTGVKETMSLSEVKQVDSKVTFNGKEYPVMGSIEDLCKYNGFKGYLGIAGVDTQTIGAKGEYVSLSNVNGSVQAQIQTIPSNQFVNIKNLYNISCYR